MTRRRMIPLKKWAEKQGIPYSSAHRMLKEGRLEAKVERVGKYFFVVEEVEDTAPKRATVLTLFTHAGGAGKTSLARDLGYELASRGYRVLLIDADPQSNLTAWLGVDPGEVEDKATLLPVVEGKPLPKPITGVLGEGVSVDLIPANMNLAMAEVVIPTRPAGMVVLRAALEGAEVRENYDFVLIDSPPSLGPIAGMAALAGDGLLVPVETSGKGIQALRSVLEVSRDYLDTLKALRFMPPDFPSFIRLIVPTKFDSRTASDRKFKNLLAQMEGVAPLSPPLSYRPAPYKEAIERGLPVQAVGDEKLREELRLVGDAVLSAFSFKDAKEVSAWA
ncbi:ParA family protein [Thermus filiformis]|uniref:Chromosome partitioning protein ParA n=1 Tax=Thermus filiformis TaxID=276 RepID=A0A0A2WMN7_THEFI|nr:AAA family ATPase [Thermus filiformis]KGQ21058.2 chromosome partitioning protein ParA [Thermus filiformis]